VKRASALIAFALLAAAAIASVTVTEAPTVYMILLADNSIEKGKPWPTTLEECVARAKAITPQGSCSIRRTFTTVTTCADEKAPKLYLVKAKNPEDGKDYWELPGADFTDDGNFTEMADLYVHAPAWPAGYPNCWIRGQAPRDEWRLNSKDEPGKAFMEHRESGMPEGDLVAEESNSVEPMPTPPGFEEERRRPADEAFRHETCVCYADDATPCPAKCSAIRPPT
jgi:hypothetical protein